MTKIFEALENAGLARSDPRGTEERVIPYLEGAALPPSRYAKPTTLPSTEKGVSAASNLYQSIVMLLPNLASRIVQFQGARKGEGTSTLVRELACLAAIKLKKKVLLLDMNQRAPNQCSFFHVQSEMPRLDASDQVKPTSNDFARIDNSSLYVTQLPAQGIPASIICEMPRIGTMLDALKEEFELILIDSPPAISCSEYLMLSPKVDGVILVVQAEKTRWQTVDKVKERILAQNGNILGVILNKRRYPIPDFIYERI